jgi:CRISPR-associated protein Csx17
MSRAFDASAVREPSPEWRPPLEPGRDDVLLEGCQPVPLSSYLKALGVLRVVSEQADSQVRGRWDAAGFTLTTSLSEDALRAFLLEEYRPTPILAPWNGGSGFYPKDKTEAIEALEMTEADRFGALRHSILAARGLINDMGVKERPEGDAKDALLSHLRSDLPEDALPWLDAAIVLTGEGPKYPPLLGTGGNDGRLEFTNNFMQRLVELINVETGEPKPSARAHLNDALFSTSTPTLGKAAIGQFSPGAAGGPNATTGFSGDSRVNPWDFVLMLEGAVLFAARPARRLEGRMSGHLAFPFTVRATGAGTGNAAQADESDARAETWMPLWSRATSLSEVRALLGEGRVSVGRKTAGDGLDFVRAVAKLGTDRGVGSFQRYGFFMRSGRAYLATPLGQVVVSRNRGADLIDQLDRGRWLERFRRYGRSDNAPARARSLIRRLEDGVFTLVSGVGGARRPLQELLIILGEIQEHLTLSEKSREACRPVPVLDAEWVTGSDDGSVEFEIAAALASLHGYHESPEGAGRVALTMLEHLTPVRSGSGNRDGVRSWDPDGGRRVVWGPGGLDRNMARVLQRRLLEQSALGLSDIPLAGWRAASLEAVGAWLAGQVDETRVVRLLKGLALARVPAGMKSRPLAGPPLPAAFAVLKPLFSPRRDLRTIGALETGASLPLPPELARLLAADRSAEAIELGVRILRVRGLRMPGGDVGLHSISGLRLLAVLMAPVSLGSLRHLVAEAFWSGRLPTPTTTSSEKDEQS